MVATSANQRATAGAIESLGAGALHSAVLNSTSIAGARATFDTSGEIHASAVTAGIEGTRLERDAVVADLGLEYRLSQTVTLGVSYDAQAGHRADDNAVRGRMEVRF